MALHSRWTTGGLEFYDGTQTVCVIPKTSETFEFGEQGEGIDIKMYGDTTGAYFHFDESADLVDFHNIDVNYRSPDIVLTTGDTLTLGTTSNRIQFITSSTNVDRNIILPPTTDAGGIIFYITNCNTTGQFAIFDGTTADANILSYLEVEETGIYFNSDAGTWASLVANTST